MAVLLFYINGECSAVATEFIYLGQVYVDIHFAGVERGTDKSLCVQSVIQKDGGVEWD